MIPFRMKPTYANSSCCQHRWAVGTSALMAFLMAPSSMGQSSPPLSVDDAVKIGLDKNPQVTAAKAGVASAYANYLSLGTLNPITLGGSHVQGSSSAPTLTGTTNDTAIDLAITFDISGQKRYQAAGANATYKSTNYTFQETLLTLQQQIRDAYWSLAAAQAQTKIADISLREAQRVYDLTVSQEKAGAAPRGDVVRSSIDVANSKQTLLAARTAERTALYAFNVLLARKPSTEAVLLDDLATTTAIPIQNLPSLTELTAQAMKSRPLLKSSYELVRAAGYSIRQNEASRFPDFTVDYQRSVETTYNTVIFSVSLPLLEFGSISHATQAARQAKKQAEATENLTRLQVEQQVAQARSDLELSVQAASDYKKEILEPSMTLLEMAQLAYKQGASGILPVIDAESTIRNARVGYINSLLAVYKAEDEVLAATGTLPKEKYPMLNKSAFALALAVVLVGCGSHPDAPTAKAETSAPKLVAVGKEKAIAMDEQSIKLAGITVAKASADDLATSTQPTGEISPTDSGTIQVTSRLPGKITEARVSTGDIVKKGQVIAMVDSVDLANAVAAYHTAVSHTNLAKNQLEQQKKLAGFGALSEQAVEDARKASVAADAAVDASIVILVVLAGEGELRIFLPRDLEGDRRQSRPVPRRRRP